MDHRQSIQILEAFVSENKQQLMERVLSQRTRHLTLVFEDIDKPHNISAVLRTAECMGIQDLHFIENKNEYAINKGITQGAAKWVTMHRYNGETDNVRSCYDQLRQANYKIYATTLDPSAQAIQCVDLRQKIALVFGTEAKGITQGAGTQADGYVHIPMNGFTESLNLSVSAAVCLTVLKEKLGNQWPPMTKAEKEALKSEWYRKVVREADLILKSKGVRV